MNETDSPSNVNVSTSNESTTDPSPDKDIRLSAQTSLVLQSFRNIPNGWELERIELSSFNDEKTGYPFLIFRNSNSTVEIRVLPEFSDADTAGEAFQGYIITGDITQTVYERLNIDDLVEQSVMNDDTGSQTYWVDFGVLDDIGRITQRAVGIMAEMSERATKVVNKDE